MLSDPKEAILKYAREGDLDGVKKCLALGDYINHTSSEKDHFFSRGMTPLHLACQYGQEHIVKFLLEKDKTDLHMRSSLGWMPIHSAAMSGNIEILKLLLSKNSEMLEAKIDDKETPDYVDCTPLLIAALERQRAAMKYLIEKGANTNAKTRTEQTLLQFAKESSWAKNRSYNLELFLETYKEGAQFQPKETEEEIVKEAAVDNTSIKLHQNAGFAVAIACLGIALLYNAPAENDSIKIAGAIMIAFGIFVMINKGGDAVNNVARSADRFFGKIGKGLEKEGLAVVKGTATATVYAPPIKVDAPMNVNAPVKACIIL